MRLLMKTIGQCLARRASETPRNTAIEYRDQSYTWEEIHRLSDYLAIRMMTMGIEKGDHVGLWSVNTPNWIITFLALEKTGAVPVLIDTCCREQELRYVIPCADIRFMYYGDGCGSVMYESMADQLRKQDWCQVERWVPMGRDSMGRWMSDASFVSSEKSQVGHKRLNRRKNQVKPQDTAAIFFTSGTTGRAKGVMLSHYNLVNSALGILEFMQWTGTDKILLAVPLYHCFGITSGLLTSIHVGCTIHLMKYFKAGNVLEHIDKYHCTVFNGTPAMFQAVVGSPDLWKYSQDSLGSGILTGSFVTEEEYQEIQAGFPHMDILPSYGQTETSHCVTLMGRKDPVEKRGSSVGRPVSHEEIRIVEPETGRILDTGKTGEIQVRGYNVMQGYSSQPEAAAAMLQEDGWLCTGDLGYLDPERYLHMVRY